LNEKELAIPSVTLQPLVAAATDLATHLLFDASSYVSASPAGDFLIHGNSDEYCRRLQQITSFHPNTHESHDQLLCSGTNTVYVELLVLVYKLSNNDIDTSDSAIQKIGEICRSKDALNFLRGLLGNKNPTIMAMAEKLLVCAVHQNDEVLTRILLQAGVSLNARVAKYGYVGCSCLEAAIERRYKNLAILLIEAGADLGDSGILWTAINVQNDLETIEYLLQHTKSDTKFLTGRGGYATYLEQASEKGNMELFQLIWRYVNASVYESDHQGVVQYIRKCLPKAAASGNQDLVRYLLSQGAQLADKSSTGKAGLYEAVNSGDIPMVQLLLSLGADPNQSRADKISRTPLQLAAEKGNIFLVNLLLEHGADVHETSFYWLRLSTSKITTTFQAGILGGNIAVVEALVEAGASPSGSEKGSELQIALQIACDQGSAGMVHLLISKGAEVNVKSKDLRIGKSALASALRSKNYDIIEILLERDADVNVPSKDSSGPTPLQVCVEYHGTDMTERLLNLGADPDDSGALWAAVVQNKVEIVHLLLKHNQSSMNYSYGDSKTSNDYGRAALVHAIEYGEHELVHILLEAGVDFRGYPERRIYSDPFQERHKEKGFIISALFAAVDVMDTNLVRLLLDTATYIDLNEGSRKSGPSALNFVDFNSPSFEEMSELVISKGASLNCYGPVGSLETWGEIKTWMTPLQNAVYWDCPEAVQYLLLKGADINSPAYDDSGRTALQIAAEENYDHMIEILLKFNADPNASPAIEFGATAIQFAAINGNFKNFQQLFEAGANIFACRGRMNGRTALEGAAEHGRLDMVCFILENSDRTEGLYFEHQLCRSIQLAREYGHISLIETIRSHRLERYKHSECYGHESVFVVENELNESNEPYIFFPHRDFDLSNYDVTLEESGLELSSATSNISSEKCDDSDDPDLENQESDSIASESGDNYDSFILNQNTDSNILPSGIQGMEFDNHYQSDGFFPTTPEFNLAIPVPNFDIPETADSTSTREDSPMDWTLDFFT
jgi:ankyrin repeat protein